MVRKKSTAAALPRPRLHRLDERSAHSFTAARLIDDECRQLCRVAVVLERRRDVQLCKTGHAPVELGDDDVVTDFAHPPQPLPAASAVVG